MVQLTATDLFGRHVADSAHYHAGIRINRAARWNIRLGRLSIWLRQFCQAKVENLNSTIVRDEDVVRLEVAIKNSLLMCRCEPRRTLDCITDRPTRRQPRSTG